MDVIKKYSLLSFSLLVTIQNIFAAATHKIKVTYNTLNQKGSGGYQVIDNSEDQNIIVQEPILLFQVGINDDLSLNGMMAYDSWTSASDSAFDEATSASLINRQERDSYSAGVKYDKKTHGVSLNVGSSEEWDYHSQYITIGGYRSFAEDNFTVGLSYSLYKDKTKLFDVSNDETKPFQDKTTKAIALDMSQILTAKDLLVFGQHFISQEGALEGSLNTVNIAGTRTEEMLPNAKFRNASYVKWVHSLSEEQALHLSYRYYYDSWGISSHTGEISWLKSFNDDDAYIELFYRYYVQSEYKEFQKDFSAKKSIMTSDADYEDLDAHQVGLFYNQDFELYDYDFNFVIGASHYNRSNNLSYETAQLSLGVEF